MGRATDREPGGRHRHVLAGIGWVAGFDYLVSDAAGLVTADLNIALLPALLGVVYLSAVLVGWIRYR
ncbi:hypothetical protein [Actinocorallia sp. A-T 12471]|uniref:hypothetical protein n=1 Tax=Actinocorallia sp. A-T 12471 TaxID=3089813 RepID=UPI0029D284C1|nr:hypothetical protein [Actinocorallia sp. A-T 12471]MDX6740245.1 hypothetical protein [Actinocorallia sp. A-T 12471]